MTHLPEMMRINIVPAIARRAACYAFSIIRQNLVPPFKEMSPYVLAMIDLYEGVRMMSNVTDCELEEVVVGLPVEAHIVEAKAGLWVSYWRPRASHGGG